MRPDPHLRTGPAIGGDAGAVDKQRSEEQHDVAEAGCDNHSHAAQGAYQVAGAQPRATAQILADTADANRRRSRTYGEEDSRKPGEATGAQHLLGEQCTDCDASGETRATQDLCEEQDCESTPLLSGLLEDADVG